MPKTLSDWLSWQATLHPAEIELGLDRVRTVADRLALDRPLRGVLTVGGTNGKGTTVAFIERLCRVSGLRTAAYTSPHLVRYNERMRLDGAEVEDAWLIEQFECVEAARGATPLTWFEYGTLAALHGFARAQADVWILEVGLGGRLDAVNVIDPDVSLVTTIALEHQQWLGDTIDAIAAEKAGILRPGRPAFFGDTPVPAGFESAARRIGARLSRAGADFGYVVTGDAWSWRGRTSGLDNLPLPARADAPLLRDYSLGLAAVEALEPTWLDRRAVGAATTAAPPPGRFQIVERDRRWIFDVAHNPQAAQVLRGRLLELDIPGSLTVVVGLQGDKQVAGFVAPLADLVARWLVCSVDGARGQADTDLAHAIGRFVGDRAKAAGSVEQALDAARAASEPGGTVLVTGSFQVVGPALSWLGLY